MSPPGNTEAQKSPGQKGRPLKVTVEHPAALKSSSSFSKSFYTVSL